MNMIDWSETLGYELIQLEEQGVDLSSIPSHLRDITGSPEELAAKCRELYQGQAQFQIRDGYPYIEPSDLTAIERESRFRAPGEFVADSGILLDRIQGAWLNGAGALPDKWIRPLHDRIESYIAGEGTQSIEKLAHRSIAVVNGGRVRWLLL
ncbi:hypothetical protein [Cohnella yongneupensis]|uniref:Uncharacterized protein n=1 Tax=Cohnella yongneupensis TaxID=425006 RepID=A0ABW0QYV6_9BACL